MSKKNKNWMVRSGSESFLLQEFFEEEIIAIGWNEIGRINKGTTLDEIKEKLKAEYSDWSLGRINQAAGQLRKFVFEFKIGDNIVTYDSASREYYIGEITSGYENNTKYQYNNYRKVEWNDGSIARDALKVASKNTLGSILSIFEVSDDIWQDLLESHPGYISDEDYENIIEAQKYFDEQELQALKRDTVSRSQEFIKDLIHTLDSEEMELLVAGILRAMGYKTRMTPRGGDLGSDIVASPDGLEMTEPIIKIEVKHKIKSRDKVGAPDIRNFVGGLRTTTKGIYVSTTGFSKEANYEAERANFQVTLVDIDRLLELLIDTYESLDSETKSLVPLRKIYWPEK